MWKALQDHGLVPDPPVPFDGHQYLGCQQVEVNPPKDLIKRKNALMESIQSIRAPQPEAPDAGGEVQEPTEAPLTLKKKPKQAEKEPPLTPEKTKTKTKSVKRAEAKLLAATLNFPPYMPMKTG